MNCDFFPYSTYNFFFLKSIVNLINNNIYVRFTAEWLRLFIPKVCFHSAPCNLLNATRVGVCMLFCQGVMVSIAVLCSLSNIAPVKSLYTFKNELGIYSNGCHHTMAFILCIIHENFRLEKKPKLLRRVRKCDKVIEKTSKNTCLVFLCILEAEV